MGQKNLTLVAVSMAAHSIQLAPASNGQRLGPRPLSRAGTSTCGLALVGQRRMLTGVRDTGSLLRHLSRQLSWQSEGHLR